MRRVLPVPWGLRVPWGEYLQGKTGFCTQKRERLKDKTVAFSRAEQYKLMVLVLRRLRREDYELEASPAEIHETLKL